VLKQILVGFCTVELVGVPPGNDHDQLVGLLVLLSVKLMQEFLQKVVALAVNAATGACAAGAPVILMLSMYNICP
jgi:hypothetical protein